MAEQFHLFDAIDEDEFLRTHRNSQYIARTNEDIYEDRVNPNFTRMDKRFLRAIEKGKSIETLDKMKTKGANPNCEERDPYDEVLTDEELYDELTHPTYNQRDFYDQYTQRYKRKHKGIYDDAMTKAIKSNNTNVAVWLINQGYVCKPSTKNPLILAMEMGNDTLVDRFLEDKNKMGLILNPTSIYNINVDGYKNPLAAAVKLNKPQYFAKLIKNGANLLFQDGAAIDEVFKSTNPKMVDVLFEGLQDQRQARALTSSAYKFDTLFTLYYQKHGDNLIQRTAINESVALRAFELMDTPPVDLVNDIIDKALSENNFDVLEDILQRDDVDLNSINMKDIVQKAIENEDADFLEKVLASDYKMDPSTALQIVQDVDGIIGPDKEKGPDSVNNEIKALFLDIIDNDYSQEDLKNLAETLGKDKEGIIFDMLKQSDNPLPPEIKDFARYMKRHNDYALMHEMYDYNKAHNGNEESFFSQLISGFLGLFKDEENDLKGLEELANLKEDGYQTVMDNLADANEFDIIAKTSFFNDENKKKNYDRLSNDIVNRLAKGFDEENKFDSKSQFSKFLNDPHINLNINKEKPTGKILLDLVKHGNYDVADELVKNKSVDINYQDEDGNDAILIAIDERENPEAANFCRNLLQRDDLNRTLKNKQGLEVKEAIDIFEGKKEEENESADNKEEVVEEAVEGYVEEYDEDEMDL